jgi:DNA-binding NtrC family response regulator
MNILVIDDNKENLQIMGDSLKIAGFKVTNLSNPQRAIDVYKNKSFDVVVTDIQMPVISGIDVIKVLMAYDSAAHVIALSGNGDEDIKQAALNKGAYAFFTKPLDFDELLRTISRIEIELRRAKGRSNLFRSKT